MSARDLLWELVHAALDERRDPLEDERVQRALAEAPECALELVRVLDGVGALARARRRRRAAIGVGVAVVAILAWSLGGVPAVARLFGSSASGVDRSADVVAHAADGADVRHVAEVAHAAELAGAADVVDAAGVADAADATHAPDVAHVQQVPRVSHAAPPPPAASAILAMRSEVTRESVETTSPSASRPRHIVRVHATRLAADDGASATRHELLAVVDRISFAE